MQDHRDFARQGNLRPFRTSPLGDVHSPAFEFREPGYARQQNIGGFIKRGAYHLIAGPRLALLWQILSDAGFPISFSVNFMGSRLLEGRP